MFGTCSRFYSSLVLKAFSLVFLFLGSPLCTLTACPYRAFSSLLLVLVSTSLKRLFLDYDEIPFSSMTAQFRQRTASGASQRYSRSRRVVSHVWCPRFCAQKRIIFFLSLLVYHTTVSSLSLLLSNRTHSLLLSSQTRFLHTLLNNLLHVFLHTDYSDSVPSSLSKTGNWRLIYSVLATAERGTHGLS